MEIAMGLTEAEIDIVRAWAAEIEAISRVYLFGSRARGNHTDLSDVDIAVVIDRPKESEGRELFEAESIVWWSELVEALGREVDLLQMRGEKTSKTTGGVQSDGILLYERD